MKRATVVGIYLLALVTLLFTGTLYAQETLEVPKIGISPEYITAEVTEITFWDLGAGPHRSPYIAELVRRFEQRNPDIDVKIVPVPWGESYTKAITAATTKTGPDVSMMTENWAATFLELGVLENLDPYLKDSPVADQINPGAWRIIRSVNGTAWAIPSTGFPHFVYYRRDWFQEAGLPEPTDQWNWDDFLEAAKKLTEPSKDRYGLSLRGARGGDPYVVSWMFAGMGHNEWFDEEGNSTFTSSGAIEGLKRYSELYTKWKVAPPSAPNDGFMQVTGNFASGTTGMLFHHLESLKDHVANLGAENVGNVPLPLGPHGKRFTPYSVGSWAVWSTSKHKDAAWRLVEFLGSQEASSYLSMGQGTLPANTLAFQEGWVKHNRFWQTAVAAVADPGQTLSYPTYLPELSEWFETFSMPEFQGLLLGRMTPEQLAEKYAGFWTEANKGYQRRNK